MYGEQDSRDVCVWRGEGVFVCHIVLLRISLSQLQMLNLEVKPLGKSDQNIPYDIIKQTAHCSTKDDLRMNTVHCVCCMAQIHISIVFVALNKLVGFKCHKPLTINDSI